MSAQNRTCKGKEPSPARKPYLHGKVKTRGKGSWSCRRSRAKKAKSDPQTQVNPRDVHQGKDWRIDQKETRVPKRRDQSGAGPRGTLEKRPKEKGVGTRLSQKEGPRAPGLPKGKGGERGKRSKRGEPSSAGTRGERTPPKGFCREKERGGSFLRVRPRRPKRKKRGVDS